MFLHKYCYEKDKQSKSHMLKLRWEKFRDIEQNNGKGIQEFYKISIPTLNCIIIKTEYLSQLSHCIGTLNRNVNNTCLSLSFMCLYIDYVIH